MAADVPPWHADDGSRDRALALLREMTLEEKIDFVTGDVNFDYGFYNAPIDRLGIPALTMADGPAGVRINDRSVHEGRSTALPAPIALAATWDPELAARYGDVLGAEAAASGHNVQLAPAVDVARVPVDGRTFESFGEDPLLQSRMVVPEILALQRHRVQATIKHLVCNNQEFQRFTVDARVDERTLREVYLPPFEAAVREGHVAAAMGAFNRINGTFACEHEPLLRGILKGELGFQGWVMSDYDATWTTAESADAGLDQEQPGGRVWGVRLLAAVRSGEVSEATIDDKVLRILFPLVAMGQLERPPLIEPLPVERHAAIAREIAEQGIVLLENGGILPLDAAALRSIAVIGPEADNVSATGGGSGMLLPARAVSPLDGIRRRAGDGVRVEHAAAVDPISAAVLLPGPPAIPSDFLVPADRDDGEAHGLTARYWANPRFEGEPALARVDRQPALNLGFFVVPVFDATSPRLPHTPMDLAGAISVEWTGSLEVPVRGDYELALAAFGTAAVTLDGEVVLEAGSHADRPPKAAAADPGAWRPRPPLVPRRQLVPERRTVGLEAGAHPIRIEYRADDPDLSPQLGAHVTLGWMPPAGVVTPRVLEAAALAARSDVAIVVAVDHENEMMDRPDLRLPHDQDGLIRAVAAANPRTIVVLMTGAPAEVEAWRDRVAAVVEAWYPGQEQGDAIARVLFGDVDASGRLPLTFPRSLAGTPVSTPEQYPGVDGVAHYSEGVFVGYRGYDDRGIEPRYPFGHGRSYTTFEYGHLRVEAAEDADAVAAIEFDVVNTGARAGVEVAQVYVGRLPGDLPTPPRQLAGWARLRLEPGERRRVRVPVARRSVSCWDVAAGGWTTAAGEVTVEVGRSSRDIRLRGTMPVG